MPAIEANTIRAPLPDEISNGLNGSAADSYDIAELNSSGGFEKISYPGIAIFKPESERINLSIESISDGNFFDQPNSPKRQGTCDVETAVPADQVSPFAFASGLIITLQNRGCQVRSCVPVEGNTLVRCEFDGPQAQVAPVQDAETVSAPAPVKPAAVLAPVKPIAVDTAAPPRIPENYKGILATFLAGGGLLTVAGILAYLFHNSSPGKFGTSPNVPQTFRVPGVFPHQEGTDPNSTAGYDNLPR